MKAETSDPTTLDLIPEVTDWTGAVRGKFAGRAAKVQVTYPIALFDEKERCHSKPALRAETTYSLYNRSSLTGFTHLRSMLQRWVDRLPAEKRKDIVGRVRHTGRGSPREEQNFNAAFFELFVHEFLIGTGGTVVVEPKIGKLTPDFGVTERGFDGAMVNYVVEATDVNLLSGANIDSNWNEKIAIDILDEIQSPDFFLHVRTEGELTKTPSRRDLRKPFEKLVNEADYERVRAIAELHGHWEGNLPSAEFRHGDWRIKGHLFPVSPGRRPKRGRFVGAGPPRGFSLDPVSKVKARLEEKSKRYKNVDQLIIALRGDWNLERDEVAEALFGRRSLVYCVPKDPKDDRNLPSPRSVQQLDGFWFNSLGPKNRNVVGVMVFTSLYPHNVDRATAMFFGNPYSSSQLPAWANEVARAEYTDGDVRFVDGVPPATFAKDHEPWQEAWELERRQMAE